MSDYRPKVGDRVRVVNECGATVEILTHGAQVTYTCDLPEHTGTPHSDRRSGLVWTTQPVAGAS